MIFEGMAFFVASSVLLFVFQLRGDFDPDDFNLCADQLQRFAVRCGLFVGGRGRSGGAIDGVTLALFVEKRPRSGKPTNCAVLRCALGDVVPEGVVLTAETFEGRLTALLEADGPPSAAELDAAFALPKAPEAVRSALADGEVRLGLLRVMRSAGWVCISNGVLELSSTRGFDTRGLVELLEPGLALAKALRAAHARAA